MHMVQSKKYVADVYRSCGVDDKALLQMAYETDPCVGSLLFYSLKTGASYDVIEKSGFKSGRLVPVSRRSFYRKRHQYIDSINNRMASDGQKCPTRMGCGK